jgi:sugar phosphate isomerase/epimerase
MRIGVYNAILHDRALPEALDVVRELGLQGLELNSGGFLPATHIPNMEEILISDSARDDYLGIFEKHSLEIAGLNCNGNPLHPNPIIGDKHGLDVKQSIRLAGRLGVTRVVTMSGLPGGEAGSTVPNWIVNAWNSGSLDVLEYQWGVAEKYWADVDKLAQDCNVKVALELHPQNLVFNVPSFLELIERAGSANIGVELDASHLFWQQMDPVNVVRELGMHVVHAAAKDVRVNKDRASLVGVLDNSFRRLGVTDERTNLGGDEWVNEWPRPAAWDFVAVGKGHEVSYWAEFLKAIDEVDPNMWVNIEHEDTSMGRVEGLKFACDTLFSARSLAG